ncbi:50S ribosomal protein L6 [Rickettsiales endosymbiont of Paramecium tredecaurelia]|uniref:50S ribosomal protein L6 n=1 Tax=Candidatus Sarmatiella mevalonica TaxID=2770581 RepID=UPI0019242CE9|nr:50S ribosomal protein L6 [Candidatus Sarmatiella mevalonica]MBL3284563.1 50S ribosomal protein L6 [Candidatus Sarmatiella mevalonica]
MSRIGKLPVVIPAGVDVKLNGLHVEVLGPKGSLANSFQGAITITQDGETLAVNPLDDSRFARAMWGTARSILQNMMLGVTSGFTKELKVVGVGYRFALMGSYLSVRVGRSHATKIKIPSYIQASLTKDGVLVLWSIDKVLLGQFAAVVRSQRKPNPYKGQGIRYLNEKVSLKQTAKK